MRRDGSGIVALGAIAVEHQRSFRTETEGAAGCDERGPCVHDGPEHGTFCRGPAGALSEKPKSCGSASDL
jgi:hypothetical protein